MPGPAADLGRKGDRRRREGAGRRRTRGRPCNCSRRSASPPPAPPARPTPPRSASGPRSTPRNGGSASSRRSGKSRPTRTWPTSSSSNHPLFTEGDERQDAEDARKETPGKNGKAKHRWLASSLIHLLWPLLLFSALGVSALGVPPFARLSLNRPVSPRGVAVWWGDAACEFFVWVTSSAGRAGRWCTRSCRRWSGSGRSTWSIANAENIAGGSGITTNLFHKIRSLRRRRRHARRPRLSQEPTSSPPADQRADRPPGQSRRRRRGAAVHGRDDQQRRQRRRSSACWGGST